MVGADMCKYLKDMKFSSLFILACGAVVQVDKAQDMLKEVVVRSVAASTGVLP